MIDEAKVAQSIVLLLEAIGEDVTREGLKDTPDRVARYWKEFIDYRPGNTDTVFEAIATDQMVIVKGIRVWSLCEHHLQPFWCDISIGYIADKKVLGLSKFARIAQEAAHQLQLQERIVHDIAKRITELTSSPDVAVIGKGEHLCMKMRGIRSEGSMITSVMLGEFRNNASTRQEFLQLTSS